MHFLSFIRKPVTTFISVRLWLWGWRKRTWSSCRSCPPWPDFFEQQSSSWAAERKIHTVSQQQCAEKAQTLLRAAELNLSSEKAGFFCLFICFFIPRGETLWVKQSPKRKTSNPHNHWSTELRIVTGRIAFNLNIYTGFFVYTHFPRKVCTVEFGIILSSLYRSVWKFPFLPKEGRRDAFEDKRHRTLLSCRDKGRQLEGPCTD